MTTFDPGPVPPEPDLEFHQLLTPPRLHRRLVVPLRPHVAAEVFVPFPMTEADWDQFLTVLAAMKPGLVKSSGEMPALLPGGGAES